MEGLPLLEQCDDVSSQTQAPDQEAACIEGEVLFRAEISEEEEEEEAEDEVPPLPPQSACWDWPLNRHEKKARVHLLERRLNEIDRRSLKQEVSGLKKEAKRLSMGSRSSSVAGRLSSS
jgi:hypothetical protein